MWFSNCKIYYVHSNSRTTKPSCVVSYRFRCLKDCNVKISSPFNIKRKLCSKQHVQGSVHSTIIRSLVYHQKPSLAQGATSKSWRNSCYSLVDSTIAELRTLTCMVEQCKSGVRPHAGHQVTGARPRFAFTSTLLSSMRSALLLALWGWQTAISVWSVHKTGALGFIKRNVFCHNLGQNTNTNTRSFSD